MINRNQFETKTIAGLKASLNHSRKIIDALDPNFADIEGRKWCIALLAELEDVIDGEEIED